MQELIFLGLLFFVIVSGSLLNVFFLSRKATGLRQEIAELEASRDEIKAAISSEVSGMLTTAWKETMAEYCEYWEDVNSWLNQNAPRKVTRAIHNLSKTLSLNTVLLEAYMDDEVKKS